MAEIEVRVRQKGKPYLKVRLSASPATIGRDPEADVFLDSTHVSRVHARLFFDATTIRIVDAGSTNGIRVDGIQHARAELAPDHTVTICDFALRARTVDEMGKVDELAEGWVDDEEEDRDEDTDAGRKAPNTNVGPRPAEDSLPSVSLRFEDVVQEGSYQSPPDTDVDGTSGEEIPDTSRDAAATHAAPAAREPSHRPPTVSEPVIVIDPEEAEELEAERLPDDVPAIISVMRNAEAQLETGRINRRSVVVEVLVSVGSRLHDVALVRPGEQYWWGKTPHFPESLWTVPDVDRFPLVSHRDPGIYDVQVPQDSTWKMFHRGDGRAPTFRSGQLVGMRVSARELAEVSYGPYNIYVRCVSAPEPLHKPFDPRPFIPKPEALAALFVAMVINIVVLAMPGNRRQFFTTPIPDEEYVIQATYQRDRPPDMPVPDIELPKETAKTTDPALVTPAPAPPVENAVVDAPPIPIRPQKRHKPDPNAGVTTIQAAVTPKQVSIGDFRVSGLLQGVPEPVIEKGKGPAVSGGAALIRARENSGQSTQTVDKSGYGNFNIVPPGHLDASEVKMAVNRHSRELYACQSANKTDGKLDLQWVVEENGNVSRVKVVLDELRSPEMTKCVREAVARWTFPQPKGGPAVVTYPFRFRDENL